MIKKRRIKAAVKKDLFTPKYKPKTETKHKGKGSYKRTKQGISETEEDVL